MDGSGSKSGSAITGTQAHLPLRFAVFVVAYNAVTTLRKVLDRIPKESWDELEEVFVFDDASQDDTVLLGEGYKATRGIDKLKIVRNEKNLGYGGNQKKGYDYAAERGFDYVILLHGDGQYAPEMIPEFMRLACERRPAAVFGSRMMDRGAARKGGMPLYKYVGNKILTAGENLLLGSRLSEFHSGYRMYAVEALRRLHYPAYTDDFHFDTQVIVELIHHGMEIVEIPIPTYYGDEICRVNGLRYAKDVMLAVLRYKLYGLGLVRCDWIGEPGSPALRYPPKQSPLSSHMRVARMVPAGARVLDVGAEGNYAGILKDKGCEVVGVNDRPVPAEVASCYEKFETWDLDAQGLPAPERFGRFDCVVMADVLEHLRSAPAALSAAKGLLKERGVVIASTGNVAHWTVRLGLLLGQFNYAKRGILDETHVHLYTNKTFRRLIEGQGYRILQRKVTPIPFELLAGESRAMRLFWKAVEYGYYVSARLWPTLFAYQFIFMVVPARGGARRDG
jgi:2-polyprenyl-3-methyl-5-hydroxy-6-metoxy-1,4-benzoquinol methylase